MKTIQNIINDLQSKDLRITDARKALILIFEKKHTPMSVRDISEELEFSGVKVNDTTIYREIEFLMEQGIILEVNFRDKKKRYEFAFQKHHHHLVCNNCESITDIELELASNLHREEKRILQKKRFSSTRTCTRVLRNMQKMHIKKYETIRNFETFETNSNIRNPKLET